MSKKHEPREPGTGHDGPGAGQAAELEAALRAKAELAERLATVEKRAQEQELTITEYTSLIKRQQAEFENFRKRTAAEKDELRQTAARDLLASVIDLQDNFEHALSGAAGAADVEAYKSGVALIARQLRELLKRFGVEGYESQGLPFDHALHEAVMLVEEGDHDGEKVVEVFRQGYTVGGKVLRLARVKVARGKKTVNETDARAGAAPAGGADSADGEKPA